MVTSWAQYYNEHGSSTCRFYDDISVLIGKTMRSASSSETELVFQSEDGAAYVFCHLQDCCESVSIEDICGDLNDLIGSPILRAEVRESHEENNSGEYDSQTWTFYEFATNKGSVTVRWYGTSNGYYSEHVDFFMVPEISESDFIYISKAQQVSMLQGRILELEQKSHDLNQELSRLQKASNYMDKLIEIMEHPSVYQAWEDFTLAANIIEPEWLKDELLLREQS